MSNDFQFSITAKDRFSKSFGDVEAKAGKAAKGVAAAFDAGAVKAARDLRDAGLEIGESFGIAGAGIAGLVRAGGPIAAMSAAAAGLITIGNRAGMSGLGVRRLSQSLDISTADLQRFRGAARMTGLSVESMDNALDSLGRTMREARFGNNPTAVAILNKLGMGIPLNAAGRVDRSAAMFGMARAMSRIDDPNAQAKLASEFGLTEILPLLRAGASGIKSMADEAQRLGTVQSPEAIARAEEYANKLFQMQTAYEGLSQTIGLRVLPTLTEATQNLSKLLEHPLESIMDVLSGRLAYRTAFGAGGTATPVRRGDERSWNGVSSAVDPTADRLPLGLRLNNPGNLRMWGPRPRENGFAKFDTPEQGLAAMAQQLGIYGRRGWNTLESVIGHYAPPSENNTGAYIDSVSKATGFSPRQPLDLSNPAQLAPLLSAMVKHEQGRQPFTAEQYQQAAQTVVHVNVTAPAGTTVTAKADSGANVFTPTRISTSMPAELTP